MSSSYSNHVNNNAFYSSDSEEEVNNAAIVYGNYFDSSVEENILCRTGGRLTSERIIFFSLFTDTDHSSLPPSENWPTVLPQM
jgi:hypothetical protein